jgi:2-keto-4-pentenoate hydratase/2-oxohepta-3-ene-1,7-dioic acid hydratase in catechol pathway
MRFVTYAVNGRPTPGVVVDDRVIPLAPAGDAPGRPALRTLVDLIEAWPAVGSLVHAAIASGAAAEPLAALDAERRWLPPVRPGKILGVGLNNDAMERKASRIADHPIVFCYPTSAMIGHLQPIEIRPCYGLTHPEPELGVVIGRRVKRISAAEAMEAVFGYTIVDDITSVDLKTDDTVVFPESFAQDIGGAPAIAGGRPRGFELGDMTLTYHARSKGTDTFAPCGPWIVARDDVADPHDLRVSLTIDGELCSQDHTGNLVHRIPQIIEYVSRWFTLEPGDIVHIGTSARGRYRLRDIDLQERSGMRSIEISGVGALTNPIKHLGD